MDLNFGALALALTILGAGSVNANDYSADKKYLSTKHVRIFELKTDVLNQQTKHLVSDHQSNDDLLNGDGEVDPTDKPGKIIGIARDIVALGEDIYKLVIKGKPSNTSHYAPISVIPKENGKPVEVFDVENFTLPTTRTFQMVCTNFYGMDTVVFNYKVMYSYRGSYNGKGAYITGAQIIPVKMYTLFGYDFRAIMKLGGIQNTGTKANPVAGATLLLEYEVSTVMQAQMAVESFYIDGKGLFKVL